MEKLLNLKRAIINRETRSKNHGYGTYSYGRKMTQATQINKSSTFYGRSAQKPEAQSTF